MIRIFWVTIVVFLVVSGWVSFSSDFARAQPVPPSGYVATGTLAGVAAVVDGDGVRLGGVEVRLQGIAAPEDNRRKREPGGAQSTRHLTSLVEGEKLVCLLDGTVTRRRPVGICYLNDQDIGALQVAAGHARDCRRFSNGRYAQLEKMAREAGRNLKRIYRLPGYCGGGK